ncbi:MAG: DUF6624 domain-containing protein, partial [Bacteroidota bacterium]
KEMEKMHTQHAGILDKIMDSIGYPTIDKVGKEGSEAAWLVIQHAIGQPDFMRKAAELLKIAVQGKQANPVNLAYLMDRISVFEERPQTYGTQFDWDENGEMSPQYIDDVEAVNQRRKSIGLNSLEEQIHIMRERVKQEQETPPTDYFQRKEEIEKWKKSVGWKE